MEGWRDGWMDGRVNGRVDEWIGRWIDGWVMFVEWTQSYLPKLDYLSSFKRCFYWVMI
jgi:hypothetical protein